MIHDAKTVIADALPGTKSATITPERLVCGADTALFFLLPMRHCPADFPVLLFLRMESRLSCCCFPLGNAEFNLRRPF